MRKGIAVAATAGVLVVAGCGGSAHIATKPVVSASVPAPAPTSAAAPPATATAPAPATVGDTVTVRATQQGTTVSVTLIKVVNPAHQGQYQVAPQPGKHYLALQFRVTDTGSAVYSDAPVNCVSVFGSTAEQYAPTVISDLAEGALLGSAGELRLGQHESAVGYVVFEVPDGTKLARILYIPDSGYSTDAAEWTVP
ncbi:hypothetical protein ABIA33_002883 [Streptacidiphilus sp. MAP12-16]|uniref:hypothetical protein n=1 Tax=Streptacidiphilus sp. MAP12-16 TaxID=3156300 RepID=UPI003519C767